MQSRLSTSYESAKGGIGSATSTVSTSIEAIVSTTRDKTVSSFEQIKEQLANVQLAVGHTTAAVGHNALGTRVATMDDPCSHWRVTNWLLRYWAQLLRVVS